MAGIRVEGNTSGNVAEVNSDNEIRIALQPDSLKAGYTTIVTENDDGTITGNKYRLSPETSYDYKLRVGVDNFIFDETFPGTVLNSSIWTAPVTTMTVALSSGFLFLNSGLSTANNAVARVSSYRSFPIYGTTSTYFEASLQVGSAPTANNVSEWGLAIASGTTAPTDGAVFRLNAGGEFRCVVIANSTEIQSTSLDFDALVGVNTSRNFVISVGANIVTFWIDDVLVATMNLQTSGYATTSSGNLPVMFRTYNTALTSLAQSMKVGYVNLALGDWAYNKPFPHSAAGAGRSSTVNQTGAATIVQTAVWTNSTNPAAATPTNTTAALGSGLSGIFIANINALAVTTDFIIQSYQVPLGTAVIPGRSLFVTGIRVSAVNTVVANGANPTTWALACAYGHTAVSLATTETATTKAPRRFPLGVQTLPATAPVGTTATDGINTSFVSPIMVQPGEFIQTILRFVSNNSAATEAINFYIHIEGYFE